MFSLLAGGPAGVIAAYTSASMGKKVILVEAKPHSSIGDKTCGDGLLGSSVNLLKSRLDIDEPFGKELACTFNKMIFRVMSSELHISSEGYMVNRLIYGQRLIKLAERMGVEVRANTRAIKAITSSNSVIGVVVQENGGEKYEIKAQITIDCSGRNYQIRRTLPQSMFPLIEKKMDKKHVTGSYREIIQVHSEHHPFQNNLVLEFHDNIPKNGYFWIFGKGPRILNAGIGWSLDAKVNKGMKEHFWERLHEDFPLGTYTVIDKGGYTIPTRYPLTNAVCSGFLTAGDAGFHANPFSAEGHGSALVSGYYAGKMAAKAVDHNDFSQERLWGYNTTILEQFGLTNIKFQLISSAFQKIRISGLELLIKRSVISEEDLANLLSENKIRLKTKLKLFFKTLPYLNILYILFKLHRNSKKLEKHISEFPTSPDGYEIWLSRFLDILGKDC